MKKYNVIFLTSNLERKRIMSYSSTVTILSIIPLCKLEKGNMTDGRWYKSSTRRTAAKEMVCGQFLQGYMFRFVKSLQQIVLCFYSSCFWTESGTTSTISKVSKFLNMIRAKSDEVHTFLWFNDADFKGFCFVFCLFFVLFYHDLGFCEQN